LLIFQTTVSSFEVKGELHPDICDKTEPSRERKHVNKMSEAPLRETRQAAETKGRILDVAERLFMEEGFAATSLRMITSQAQVNLAAVNYHFGSKEALVEAVLTRRLAPLNRIRVEELTSLEDAGGGKPLGVETILRAFVGAAAKLGDKPSAGGAIFLRLLGRAFTEPTEHVRNVLQRQYAEVANRFRLAFAAALPHLPEEELAWRMQFTFGAISYVMAGTDVLQLFATCRLSDMENYDAVMDRLVTFLAAGLKAPMTSNAG
jgi:AcrR family transcriptional regulator